MIQQHTVVGCETTTGRTGQVLRLRTTLSILPWFVKSRNEAKFTMSDFWKMVKGLVCVCGTGKCDTDECRLVQYMNREVKEFYTKRAEKEKDKE